MNEQKYKRTGISLNKLSMLAALGILFSIIVGCSIEPSGIKRLWVTKKKDGLLVSDTFKPGDTIYAKVTPRTFTGKVKIKFYMTAGEDYEDAKKDEKITETDEVLEINENEVAHFSVELSEEYPSRKLNLVAEMINEEGKKIDTKAVEIEVTTKE